MTKPLYALFAAFVLLAACTAPSSTTAGDPPLAGAKIGGPFTLIDSSGAEVKWSDFDGKYRVVYFGYTFCPDVCPFDVQRMVKGYNLFKQRNPQLAAQIQPIFITIDPARDTPAVVGEFTSAFSDDLIGLTGSPEQIKQAADAFVVYSQKGEDMGDGAYLVDHSRGTFLMGRKGEPIALLPVDDGPEAVAEALEKWTS